MNTNLIKSSGFLFSVSVLLLSGCAHGLTPRLERLNSAEIPYAVFSSSIRVVNDQPNDEKVLIGELGGGRKYYASLHDWTELVVQAFQQEVTLRGGSISADSSREIKLRVSNVFMSDGGGGRRKQCTVTLQVETGNGLKKEFSGTKISGGHGERAAGGGVTLALTAMLKDRQILDYMK